MYAALDPVYMVMLIKLLGPGYEVWDKAASVAFLKPGRETLFATFRVEAAETDSIKSDVSAAGKTERHYVVELLDRAGSVCARCEKRLTIRHRTRRKPPR